MQESLPKTQEKTPLETKSAREKAAALLKEDQIIREGAEAVQYDRFLDTRRQKIRQRFMQI